MLEGLGFFAFWRDLARCARRLQKLAMCILDLFDNVEVMLDRPSL
jgi:hypothetical protein